MTSVTSAGMVYLGMDTSKDTIVVAVLEPGEELPAVDRIINREEAVRRLVGRFAELGRLRACYEAGPGVMTCTGCWPRWGWPAMWSPRR